MLTITAVIQVKKGSDGVMRDALLKVADNVSQNEPDTISFYISQDRDNPCIFTTYERFSNEAAMDHHNNSSTVAEFFSIAKPLLEGDVILHTCNEVSAK